MIMTVMMKMTWMRVNDKIIKKINARKKRKKERDTEKMKIRKKAEERKREKRRTKNKHNKNTTTQRQTTPPLLKPIDPLHSLSSLPLFPRIFSIWVMFSFLPQDFIS